MGFLLCLGACDNGLHSEAVTPNNSATRQERQLAENIARIDTLLPIAAEQGWAAPLEAIRTALELQEPVSDLYKLTTANELRFGYQVCRALYGDAWFCTAGLMEGRCPGSLADLQPNHVPKECTPKPTRVKPGTNFGLFLLAGGNPINAHRYGASYVQSEALCFLTGLPLKECFDVFGAPAVGDCIMRTHSIEECREIEALECLNRWGYLDACPTPEASILKAKRIKKARKERKAKRKAGIVSKGKCGGGRMKIEWDYGSEPLHAEPDVYREAGFEPPDMPFEPYEAHQR